MRILQLRFKNLNSLVGEWQIDLTHPAFLADGIFAITGPTGAGKSTILDAMCLALYGRTPRLRNISKSSNEIMSRQTGDCFAEVIFETHAGRFRCHWSQHRARKKAEGELQSPKHEIADADSGQIIEAKILGVAEQIEKITGMDFDRFTRSMLLAQGGFAAFLQADADQRAPILEQITGTEIYSHISIKVHELRVAETKKLDLLQAELAGMHLLSEDDEQQLMVSLAEKVHDDTVLNKQLTDKNNAIVWQEGIARLAGELQTLGEQQQDLMKRQQLFKPELDRLERATQALTLAADHAGLTALRDEQLRNQQSLLKNQQLLPDLTEQYQHALKNVTLTTSALALTKKQQKEALIAIRNVREIDLKIHEKQAPIKSAQTDIEKNEQQLSHIQSQHQCASHELEEKRTTLADVTDLLNRHQSDAGLIEQLSSIQHKFSALDALSEQQKHAAKELERAQQQQQNTAQRWQVQSTLLQTQQDEFERLQNTVTQTLTKQAERLEQGTLYEWRQELAKQTTRKTALEHSQLSLQLIDTYRQELTTLIQQQSVLMVTDTGLSQQLSQQNLANTGLERECQLLETQYQLQKKIASYEDARQHLQDDEPCPLCGSNDHPYAQGNVPLNDDTNTELSRAKTALTQGIETVATLRVQHAENQKDLAQNSQQQQTITNKIIEQENTLKQHSEALAIAIDGDLTDVVLSQLQYENTQQLTQATAIVADVEQWEQQLVSAREFLDKKRVELTSVEKALQLAQQQKQLAEQAADSIAVALAKTAATLHATQHEILNELKVYGIESVQADTLQQLTARRDQWRVWQQNKGELDTQTASLISQIKHQADQVGLLKTQLKTQQQALNQLRSEDAILHQERIIVFADKNPDEEETRLSHVVEQAEMSLETVRQIAQGTEQAHHKVQHSIDALTTAMASCGKQLILAETDFNQRLTAVGFNDEEAYKIACLNDEERQVLQQQDQLLKNEYAALTARLQDNATQLASEREKQLTEQPLDVLKEEQAQVITALNTLQQKIGGIRQKLADNDNIRLQQHDRLEQITAQKRECDRWNTLHELIGSADGKKYRNFAQGLTFEMMIGHANRQLQKMTDRYLLIRDEAQPLELNVVDNYQAGETRSTKNLSGGESFIVSLALALGLSQMASKNVRVDSLFLDEGFGTLDDEALDTALETLAGLQQEGKLIGVISHVQVLKERISTQIQIIPSSGGRSKLSGPGITSLSTAMM